MLRSDIVFETYMHFIKQQKIGWIKSWNNNVVGWTDVNGFYTKQNHTRTNGSLQGLATMICGLQLSYPFPFQLDPWPWIPKTHPKLHRIPTRGRYPSEVDDSPQLNCYQTHFMNHSSPCLPATRVVSVTRRQVEPSSPGVFRRLVFRKGRVLMIAIRCQFWPIHRGYTDTLKLHWRFFGFWSKKTPPFMASFTNHRQPTITDS